MIFKTIILKIYILKILINQLIFDVALYRPRQIVDVA